MVMDSVIIGVAHLAIREGVDALDKLAGHHNEIACWHMSPILCQKPKRWQRPAKLAVLEDGGERRGEASWVECYL